MGAGIVLDILPKWHGKDGQIILQVMQAYPDHFIGLVSQRADVNILLVSVTA